jgi:Rhamnan synthesis protein F
MLHAAVGRLYEPFIQRRHDRNRDQLLQVHDGKIGASSRVSLFLIYQPKGLSPTVAMTCAHFAAKGYSPLVISNTPLSERDLTTLAIHAWKVVIRPNYGYDFGGYRDGILWLQDHRVDLEHLVVLNDSIWFPVWPEETLIDRMSALNCDLAGAVIHPAQKRKSLSTRRPAFLESYLYLINRTALESPAFRAFWRDYQVSSIKFNAVYRGERSFSHALEQAGHSVKSVIDGEGVIAAIRAQDDDFLRKTLSYGAYTDPEFETERDALMVAGASSSSWRERALAHVERVIRRRSIYASFPFASFHLMNVPFVKKSRLLFFGQAFGTVQIKMRTQLLRAVQNEDIPRPFPEVLAEMLAIEPSVKLGSPTGPKNGQNE